MSRRNTSKRARRQASSMPIVAMETNVTTEVPTATEQLEINSEVAEVIEDDVSNMTPAQLNLLAEYKRGSKESFYKSFKTISSTIIEREQALASQAAELSMAYSTNERLNLLMEEQKVMTDQEKATLEAKITSLEEHISSLKEGTPQMIPLFGKSRLSYESDFRLRADEHTKEWNNLMEDGKKLYAYVAPKVSKFIEDTKVKLQTLEIS